MTYKLDGQVERIDISFHGYHAQKSTIPISLKYGLFVTKNLFESIYHTIKPYGLSTVIRHKIFLLNFWLYILKKYFDIINEAMKMIPLSKPVYEGTKSIICS